MSSIVGFGRQRQDVEFGTLSCLGTIIIDKHCNLHINNIDITGNLIVEGNNDQDTIYFTATRGNDGINIPEFTLVPIVYDSVSSNTGLGYDSMTGIITILTSGVYEIIALTNLEKNTESVIGYAESRISTSTGVTATFSINLVSDAQFSSMIPKLGVFLNIGDTIQSYVYHRGGPDISLATNGNVNICVAKIS